MTIRIIFNGLPEDAETVVAAIVAQRGMFERDYLPLGSGWHLSTVSYAHKPASGRDYFLRRIKKGVSASPMPAQGIETGTAETEGLGPKDESPVA